MRNFFVKSAVALGLAVGVCLALWPAERTRLAEDAERWSYDLLVNSAGYPPAPPYIVLVDFDDATVDELNYPVPREKVAEVVNKVAAGGAKTIGLDILLPQPTSEKEDGVLAQAIGDAGNVVVAGIMKAGTLERTDPLPMFCDMSAPPDCGAAAAAGIGFVNLPVDDDGFVRRMNLTPTGKYPRFSFAVVLASRFGERTLRPGKPNEYLEWKTVGGEITRVPLDDSGKKTALIGSWEMLPKTQIVSAREVLRPDFAPGDRFRNKLVIIGQGSAAARDHFFTPLYRAWGIQGTPPMISGPEIHAAAIATLLEDRGVWVWNARWNWLACFLAALLVMAAILGLRPGFAFLAVVVCAAVVFGAGLLLFQHHLWMKLALVEGAVALAVPIGLAYRFLEERFLKSRAEEERAYLMGLFSRYVSPEVAAEIWRRRSEIVLAGEEKTVTVLFSDIRNFTATTAGRPSGEVLVWLNEYFSLMDQVVREHGGYLNKFIGDGLMVVFGSPLGENARVDAERAVRCALRMHQAVEELNHKNQGDAARPQIKIGIGIHTGVVTAGNVGSRERLEYSVIGETVNLASRLESLTKDFKTNLVLSPATWKLVKDAFVTNALGEATVRGFEGSMIFYTASAERGRAAAASEQER